MFRAAGFWLTCVLLPFSLSLPATAQEPFLDFLQCRNGGNAPPLEVQISRCTGVLQAGNTPTLTRAFAYYRRGILYFRKKEYDRAIADLTQALLLNHPQPHAVYKDRGRVYFADGDYDRAIADFTESIKLDAKDPVPYDDRARVHDARKEYDRVIADLTEAVRLDPDNAITRIRLGRAHHAKIDYDNAIAAFTEAIKIRPSDTLVPRLRRALACHRKGLRACVASDIKAVTEEMGQQTASAIDYYDAAYVAQILGHYILAAELIDNAISKLGDGTLTEKRSDLDERKRDVKGWSGLEGDWIQYLAEIQSENNFANWTSPPYDLYLQSNPR
jgi:tetratricopeptide (TPR) repeat protein